MSDEHSAIELRSSPHFKATLTTDQIMLNVVWALIPVSVFAVYTFGVSVTFLLVVTTASCLLTEYLICRFTGKPSTLPDYSAVITGLLLGLTLPPGFPLWMAALGGFVSIALGKALFGALGHNVFNPALVGRAFLQAAFPVAITTWTPPHAVERFTRFIPSTLAFPFAIPDWEAVKAFSETVGVDGWTGATPLMIMKFDFATPLYNSITDLNLAFGSIAGSSGETCAVLILLGGIYLVARGMMDWRPTVSMLATAFVLSALFWLYDKSAYPTPVFMLFSGGLMLGAVFMATDMVTSPTTPLGNWIFGALAGAMTVIVRLKGGLPEGVMYGILLANAVTPLINDWTQPRIYGATKAKKTS